MLLRKGLKIDHKLVFIASYAIQPTNFVCLSLFKMFVQHLGEKDYYEKQFATLKSFEDVDLVVSSEGLDEEDLEEQAQHERAMRISNYANILLLAFKVRNFGLNVVLNTN